jgi:hypothetical protein
MEYNGGIILAGKTEELGEILVPVSLCSQKKPTWIEPVANMGLRGERSATNRLSHGTVKFVVEWCGRMRHGER